MDDLRELHYVGLVYFVKKSSHHLPQSLAHLRVVHHMKKPFFARHALTVLMVVFFLVPFAFRGARMAVQRMKNDVKDWLPSDFKETSDLDWFRSHFLGEQFVVASWEGCTGKSDDDRFAKFVDGFFPEIPPSIIRERKERAAGQPLRYPQWRSNVHPEDFTDDELQLYTRQLAVGDLPPEDQFLGNRLGLFALDDDRFDWGGQQEKWLKGKKDRWYYILPNGDLYRWTGGSTIVQPIVDGIQRLSKGKSVSGELVVRLGEIDGPWYYEKPSRLSARLIKSVTTGPGLLHLLTKQGGVIEGETDLAHQRLGGVFFGPNKEQTCLVLTLTDAAKEDLRRCLGRGILGKPTGHVLKVAEAAGVNIPPKPSLAPPFITALMGTVEEIEPTLKLGGPPVDNVAIDEEGQITLVRLVGLSLLVGLILSWLSFRSFKITAMVFFVGGISAVTSLSMVFWSDSSVDAILMSMPSLVYVLGLSGAVHIVNYYHEAVEESGIRGAPEKALGIGWKPCTLAAFTTALGLLSLSASNILPIRKFGIFSAIGVLATLLLLFSYLPAALETWPPRRFKRTQRGDRSKKPSEGFVDRFWQGVGRFVTRHCRPVAIVCLLFMGLIGWGINQIQPDVQLLKMFDPNATIIQHYHWLETNLGKLIPMEIVVKVSPESMRHSESNPDGTTNGLNFLERLEISKKVQQALAAEFGEKQDYLIGQTMSAATFATELPGANGGSLSYRGGLSRLLEAHRDEFFTSDHLRIDEDGSELWRISLRIGALRNIDYGEFVTDLKHVVEPIMAAYAYREKLLNQLSEQHPDGYRGLRVVVTGVPSADEGTTESVRDPIAQTRLFAKTLLDLLENASLRRYAVQQFADDPKLAAAVKKCDGVIKLSARDQYSPTERDGSQVVIDASQHLFSASPNDLAERTSPISAVYTGVVPVVYKAQKTLLRSLVESTGLAFVMIAVVMIVLLRNRYAGMLSMLPNVFPVVVIFGAMGWSRTVVDIGSMMTASVAMGVAVDDTIHFLTWFRQGLDQGMHRVNAIMLAYKRCGMAMTQTTAIGGLGLSIFAFSTFTPTQRFGTLMLALLVAALVGDLIFLPALLASPLGRVFDRKRKLDSQPEEVTPHKAIIEKAHHLKGRYVRRDQPWQ